MEEYYSDWTNDPIAADTGTLDGGSTGGGLGGALTSGLGALGSLFTAGLGAYQAFKATGKPAPVAAAPAASPLPRWLLPVGVGVVLLIALVLVFRRK